MFDKLKNAAEGVRDKLAGHEDQVKAGLDKVGDVIDQKTGGRYTEQIDSAEQKAAEFLTKKDEG